MKTHVSNNRLLKLVKLLKKLPPKRFSLDYWVGNDWKGEADLSCGTKACALGWATTIPSLRKEGLRLRPNRFCGGFVVILTKNGSEVASNLDAAAAIFGITVDAAHRLFMADDILGWDATAKQVAKRIEAFIAERGPST